MEMYSVKATELIMIEGKELLKPGTVRPWLSLACAFDTYAQLPVMLQDGLIVARIPDDFLSNQRL